LGLPALGGFSAIGRNGKSTPVLYLFNLQPGAKSRHGGICMAIFNFHSSHWH
jgi:hypothetical protein